MYEKFGIDLVDEEEADVVMFGVELGENPKSMLDSLRKESWFVEFFDIDQKRNLIEGMKIADAGNMKITKGEDITKRVEGILAKDKLPFMFSKSHLATYYALKAFPKDIKIISFDAHSDTKSNYIDEVIGKSFEPLKFDEAAARKCNAASWLRMSLESGIKNAAVIGVRSCDEFDLGFMKERNILFFTPKQIREDLSDVRGKIRDFVKDSTVYLSIDIDAFDPAIAPAVDHPEADGIFYPQFFEILREIFTGRVAGIDLVEMKPVEGNVVTEFLAVKIIYEILGLLPRAGVA